MASEADQAALSGNGQLVCQTSKQGCVSGLCSLPGCASSRQPDEHGRLTVVEQASTVSVAVKQRASSVLFGCDQAAQADIEASRGGQAVEIDTS